MMQVYNGLWIAKIRQHFTQGNAMKFRFLLKSIRNVTTNDIFQLEP